MVLGLGRAVEAEASYVAGFPVACLLVSYRPLAMRSLNARGALEAAPRGDTSSN